MIHDLKQSCPICHEASKKLIVMLYLFNRVPGLKEE